MASHLARPLRPPCPGSTSLARWRPYGFDRPRVFSAYLHALRWNCVTATDPTLFQAPHRAGIQVLNYQLEPLRMALRLPRVVGSGNSGHSFPETLAT